MPSASFPPEAAEILPAEDARDPERWLTALCWTVVVFALLQILLFGFGRDQAAHALVGEVLLHGGMPYRDAWDPSAPGIFLLHAAIQGLLGKSMFGPRLIEVSGLLAMVFCFRWLGGTLFGSRLAGLCGGAIAALVHAQLEFWQTAQPESFAGFLTAGALVVTVQGGGRINRRAAALGLLVGGIFLLKPSLAAAGVVCGAYLARRLQVTRGGPAVAFPALVLGLCTALPVLLCAAWFVLRGAWGDLWWTATELVSARAETSWAGRTAPELFYSASTEALVGFSALLMTGTLAVLILPPLYAREREGLFLVFGVLSVQFAGVALEAHPAPHHYGATLPLLALVSGVGWYKLWRRLVPSGAPGLLAFATFLAVIGSMREATRDLPQGFWQRSALRTGYLLRLGPVSTREELDRKLATQGDYQLSSIRRVAQELNHQLSPEDSVYVGDEPMVYWLSSARPATRFLRGAPDEPSAARWASELRQDLEARRPSYVVIRKPTAAPASPSTPWLESNYQETRSIDDFALYRRRLPENQRQ